MPLFCQALKKYDFIFFATKTNTDEKMEIADLEIDDSYTIKLSLEVSKENKIKKLLGVHLGQEAFLL